MVLSFVLGVVKQKECVPIVGMIITHGTQWSGE